MTTTPATTAATTSAATQAGAKTAEQRSRLNQTYDDFLTLLTTQMQYQDPLNPVDSKEFTQQLVSFSQVEQQLNTNTQLQALNQALLGRGLSAALGFVGMEVGWKGDQLPYAGGSASIGYEMPSGATQAKVSIFAGRELIWSGDAKTAAGSHSLTWDGKDKTGKAVDPGAYTVSVSAVDKDGESLTVPVTLRATVQGVETGSDGGTRLDLGQGVMISDSAVTRAHAAKPAG